MNIMKYLIYSLFIILLGFARVTTAYASELVFTGGCNKKLVYQNGEVTITNCSNSEYSITVTRRAVTGLDRYTLVDNYNNITDDFNSAKYNSNSGINIDDIAKLMQGGSLILIVRGDGSYRYAFYSGGLGNTDQDIQNKISKIGNKGDSYQAFVINGSFEAKTRPTKGDVIEVPIEGQSTSSNGCSDGNVHRCDLEQYNPDNPKKANCFYKSDDFTAVVHFTNESGATIGNITYFNSNNINKRKRFESKIINTPGATNLDTVYAAGNSSFPVVFIKYDTINSTDSLSGCPSCLSVYLQDGQYNGVLGSKCLQKVGDSSEVMSGKSVAKSAFWSSVTDTCDEGDCFGKEPVNFACNSGIFGSISDNTSIAYFIDKALKVIRILVIGLLITLGTIDMAKAVIAQKEDEMKKAQTTFLKRLLAGMLIFLAPVIVSVIMNWADLAWQGSNLEQCSLEEILKDSSTSNNYASGGARR